MQALEHIYKDWIKGAKWEYNRKNKALQAEDQSKYITSQKSKWVRPMFCIRFFKATPFFEEALGCLAKILFQGVKVA